MQDGKVRFSLGTIQGLNYITEFLMSLMIIKEHSEIMEVLEHPYFTYWLNQGKYKNAGDSGMYNYLFGKKRNLMTSEENLKFTFSGYNQYFGESEIAVGIVLILRQIYTLQDEYDFCKRKFTIIK